MYHSLSEAAALMRITETGMVIHAATRQTPVYFFWNGTLGALRNGNDISRKFKFNGILRSCSPVKIGEAIKGYSDKQVLVSSFVGFDLTKGAYGSLTPTAVVPVGPHETATETGEVCVRLDDSGRPSEASIRKSDWLFHPDDLSKIKGKTREQTAPEPEEKADQNPCKIPGPKDLAPWLIADQRDPIAEQPWYIPARYFARELVKSDSTLLIKRPVLAKQVAHSLGNAGVLKRGGKKPLLDTTILKALANIDLG